MAIALVYSAGSTPVYSSGYPTISANLAGATLLVVGISHAYGTISGVTYAGAALTRLAALDYEHADGTSAHVWYMLSPASGTNNIAIAGGSGGADTTVQILGYTGNHMTTPFASTAKNNVATVDYAISTDVSFTAAATDGLLVLSYTWWSSTYTLTATSGYTQYAHAESPAAASPPNVDGYAHYKTPGSSGSLTFTMSYGGATSCKTYLMAMVIQEPAGGGSQSADAMGIGSTSALGLPSVTPTVSMTVQGIPPGSALGLPAALPGGVSVTVLGIAPTSAVGMPSDSLVMSIEIEVEGIPSMSMLGEPGFATSIIATAMGIASTSALGLAAIPWPQEFEPSGIPSGAQLGNPEGYTDQAFDVVGTPSGSRMGMPVAHWSQWVTMAGVPSSSRAGRPRIRGVITYPLVIQPGETKEIKVTFTPAAVGLRPGSLEILATDRVRPLVPLLGRGTSGVLISISDGVFGDSDEIPVPTSLSAQVLGIPSGSAVGFPSIEVTGEVSWLTTAGRLTLDEDGNEFLLRSINYYGLEQAGVPYGVWAAPYKTITVGETVHEGMLDMIKRLGFNSIRLLVSVDMTMKDVEDQFFRARTLPQSMQWNSTFVDHVLNPDLVSSYDEMTGYNVPVDVITMLDRLVDHCEAIGLRIVLDMHCLAADSNNVEATQGRWYTTTTPDGAPAGDRWTRWDDGARRNEAQYIAAWEFYADRYKDRPTVCGFDLLNEPYHTMWDRSADKGLIGIYERVGAAIHAINPNVLLICEGTGNQPGYEAAHNFDATYTEGEKTWGSIWSGFLVKAADPALRVGAEGTGITPNKIIYSPHEYGSEAGPAWFTQSLLGLDFPLNLPEVWRQQWGYLSEENIAPVWIGEFGSTWRIGDSGFTAPMQAKDAQWLEALAAYCNENKIGFAFWGFVPDIIGGLVESDYTTVRDDKMVFLEPFLNPVEEVVPALRLSISGTQLLDVNNDPVTLKAINWYGVNLNSYVPHGLWGGGMNWVRCIETMQEMGFNCIRIPFCRDFTTSLSLMPGEFPTGGVVIDFDLNPDLAGKTAHEIFRMILDQCETLGMRVIIDMHQNSGLTTGLIDGDPLSGGTLQEWIDSWLVMANEYGDHPAIVGFELYNEPHVLTWDAWADMFEACANQIHEVVPHMLVLAAGVANVDNPSEQWMWGQNLTGAIARPIELALPNRLIYAPHEYGQITHDYLDLNFPWLKSSTQDVVGYPSNLYAFMRSAWGHILVDRVAPLMITEFGGAFGGYSDRMIAEPTDWPSAAYELQWLDAVTRFLNGEYYGDSEDHKLPGEVAQSFGYWCFQGGGGDNPFGIMTYNWRVNVPKRALLDDLLGPYDPPAAVEHPLPVPGWYMELPDGLTGTYIEETRVVDGFSEPGTKLVISGTTTAAGEMIFATMMEEDATVGEVKISNFGAQVDVDSPAITQLWNQITETNTGNVWLTADGTDWHATRMTLANRTHTRTLTNGAAAHAKIEFYTNNIPISTAVNMTLWVGMPRFT